MRALANLLFVAGMLIAACFAARAVSPQGTGPEGLVTPGDRMGAWWGVAGVPFTVGALLMVAGGVLARRLRKLSLSQGTEHEGFVPEGAVEQALEGEAPVPRVVHPARDKTPKAIVARIEAALAALDDAALKDIEAVHRTLDDILENEVPDFLEQREPLIARLGLAKFAEMIGHFAMMERNVARAWSAITDGVPSEVPECVERATVGAREAKKGLG